MQSNTTTTATIIRPTTTTTLTYDNRERISAYSETDAAAFLLCKLCAYANQRVLDLRP